MKHLLLIISLLAAYVSGFAQEPSFQLKTDREDILIGEQLKLTLTLTAGSADTVRLPQITDTLRKEVEVLSRSKVDTAYEGSRLERKVLTQTFVLTSFDSGYFVVEPLQAVVNGDTINSNPFLVAVQTVTVDTAKGPVDIKDIAQVPFAWDEWLKENWYWFALGVTILVAIYFLARYLKRREPEEPVIPKTPSIPPHQHALQRLTALAEQELWQKDKYKAYYSELTDIFREYIEARFSIPALEQTSDELIRAMAHQPDFGTETKAAVKRLLFLADLVKFAKERPLSQENEQHFETVKRFIESTAPQIDKTEDSSLSKEDHG